MSQSFTLNPMARHRQRCRHIRAAMSDYLDGELDEARQIAVERHLRWCPSCRRMLASLRRTIEGLHALTDLAPADRPRAS
ncbi:MAG: anti-sigma factor family protein [Solirubrobacteraceae bacterium]